ncbi:hypothetical protein [Olivibacter oleidegradans]|uniref:Histidine kinase/DNA gyrase B/HSP90-like ATPase n=1 Tax=Olivibacter oleidegradans TaxID=760123 RepID=A0ABV6HNE3_9SPHI
MALIKIKNTLKISDFDKLYKDLYFLIDEKSVIDVELPKQINKNFFSVTSGLIQFVATWIRFGHAGKLIIDLENEKDQIEKIYQEEFFFPVIAMVWNDVDIINLSGKSFRSILRKHQNEFTVRMRKIEPLKGEKLLLVNFDHFDNNSGILPFFEIKNSFVTNEESLHDSLRLPILNEVLKYSRRSREDFSKIFTDISGIIYELMKNTFEWARDDEFQVPFSPSIRGVYVRFFKRSRTTLLEEYQKSKPIREYFSNEINIENNDLGQVYFIEISVFDSGSGFVRKFKNVENENTSDIDIIKKCLIKNQTSSTSLFKEEKGIGLDRILKILNNKGFLKITTDKYSLYRNLIESVYKPISIDNFQDVELRDWWTQSDTKFTKSRLTSGSNINILYPLSQSPKTI